MRSKRLAVRSLRLLTAVSLTAVLAGCGEAEQSGDSPGGMEAMGTENVQPLQQNGDSFVLSQGIEINGKYGQLPTITVPEGFQVEESNIEILYDGSGPEITETDTVLVDYSIFDLDTAEVHRHTYHSAPVAMNLGGVERATIVHRALIGAHIGSRVTVVQPRGENNDHNTFTVLDILPNTATGEEVPQRSELPQVQVDDSGDISLDIPEDFQVPTKSVVQPIIKGLGAQVADDQQVLVQLLAVRLPSGEVLDSTWEAERMPVNIDLSRPDTLEEWSQAIVGQTVGSRTLIVLPLAESADSVQVNGAIAYVVDILHADYISQEE